MAISTDRGAFQRFGGRVRRRFLWAFLAFGFFAASTWWFRQEVFVWLLAPAEGKLSPFEGGPPVFTAPTDMLSATIGLALRGGALGALPVLAVGVYTLARPVLPRHSRRFFVFLVPAAILLPVCGVAFGYYVMLPTSIGFLLNFGDGVAVPLITITEYLDLLMSLMFWLGLVFEMPLVMYALAKMRVVSYLRMRRLRKFVPFTAFFLAAIITPTFDPLNSTLIAVPIIVLYEVGLFLAWLARPEKGDYMAIKKMRSAVAGILRKLRP